MPDNEEAKSMVHYFDLIKKSSLLMIVSILLYRLSLDASYYLIVSNIWDYKGFIIDFDRAKLIESYMLMGGVLLLMPKSTRRLSAIMVWMFILIAYIPMLTLFAFKNEPRAFMYGVSGYWVMILLIIRLPDLSFVQLAESKFILWAVAICTCITVCLLLLKSSGLSLNFNLANVYEIRSEFSEKGIPFAGYLVKWLSYIVNPMLFAVFFIRKKWIALAGITCIQLFVFSSTGHKTFLFSLVLVAVLILLVKKEYFIFYMPLGLAVVVLTGMLSYFWVDDVWITSLFTRRALLTQPMQYFYYYDFFSQNPQVHLSGHSFFNLFLRYPYDIPPANIIGDIYYGSPKSNANTGLVGDAYMNFGFLGLTLWAVITGGIMKLVDSFSKGVDLRVAVAIIAMPIMTLTNSALVTNLLTHGLSVSLLFLYLISKRSEAERKIR